MVSRCQAGHHPCLESCQICFTLNSMEGGERGSRVAQGMGGCEGRGGTTSWNGRGSGSTWGVKGNK